MVKRYTNPKMKQNTIAGALKKKGIPHAEAHTEAERIISGPTHPHEAGDLKMIHQIASNRLNQARAIRHARIKRRAKQRAHIERRFL